MSRFALLRNTRNTRRALRVSVCRWACVCVWVGGRVSVCMYVCSYVCHTYLHTYIHTDTRPPTHNVCAHACLHVCMYVCVCVCTYVCVCVCTNVSTQYASACVYVYACACTRVSLYASRAPISKMTVPSTLPNPTIPSFATASVGPPQPSQPRPCSEVPPASKILPFNSLASLECQKRILCRRWACCVALIAAV